MQKPIFLIMKESGHRSKREPQKAVTNIFDYKRIRTWFRTVNIKWLTLSYLVKPTPLGAGHMGSFIKLTGTDALTGSH